MLNSISIDKSEESSQSSIELRDEDEVEESDELSEIVTESIGSQDDEQVKYKKRINLQKESLIAQYQHLYIEVKDTNGDLMNVEINI